ncbi:MAG TPA: methionyl-tRNA formyltransferase [Planctomycetota bacterium]|nr:methionyl-tRNA formyltransferase [Planctomycetota bacterium]
MRFVFFGSPPFATPVLERLLQSRHAALGVVTLPDRPRGRGRETATSELVLLARDHAIPVFQPADPHAADFIAELRALSPDVMVVASYGVIMKDALLSLAPRGALNVHASLLPRHRGASPIQAAILAGDELTGVSLQRIVARLDEGDVLATRERAIGPDETAGDLLEALAPLGGELAVEGLDLLESGRAVFTPQDHARSSYARKLKKEQGRVDFTRAAQDLARQVRAQNPWPGARCLDPKGRELVVLRARAHGGTALGTPGELVETSPRLLLACGEGSLELIEIVLAGKRPMPAADYLRGARFSRGERFASLPEAPAKT